MCATSSTPDTSSAGIAIDNGRLLTCVSRVLQSCVCTPPNEGQGFLVVWDWQSDSENTDCSTRDRRSSIEPVSLEKDTQESYVPFKGISVTPDTRYLDILREVRDGIQSGDTVPVKMVQEPDNVFDSQALLFSVIIVIPGRQ